MPKGRCGEFIKVSIENCRQVVAEERIPGKGSCGDEMFRSPAGPGSGRRSRT